MDDFGKGLEDFGRSLEVKTGGSNPKTSKTRISLFNLKFPYFSYRKTNRETKGTITCPTGYVADAGAATTDCSG